MIPLATNKATEHLNEDRTEYGKNKRYGENMPFFQLLPPRQWTPDEGDYDKAGAETGVVAGHQR